MEIRIEQKKIVGERIREFAKMKYGSLKHLGEVMGMKPQTIQQYVNGKAFPGGPVLKKLSELGADVTYILTGIRAKEIAKQEVYEEMESLSAGFDYPLVSMLSAGSMIEFFNDEITEKVSFSYPKKYGCMALKVHGDSMHPTIEDGDIVLVDSGSSLYEGCIVAARLKSGEQLVKRYRVLPHNLIQLDSDNFLYEPITVSKEDIEIIMPVVKIQRDVYNIGKIQKQGNNK